MRPDRDGVGPAREPGRGAGRLSGPVRAEAHAALYRAGAGDEHGRQVLAILGQMCAHLTGEARQAFNNRNPIRRLLTSELFAAA